MPYCECWFAKNVQNTREISTFHNSTHMIITCFQFNLDDLREHLHNMVTRQCAAPLCRGRETSEKSWSSVQTLGIVPHCTGWLIGFPWIVRIPNDYRRPSGKHLHNYENHPVSWVNQLFLWPCLIFILVCHRVFYLPSAQHQPPGDSEHCSMISGWNGPMFSR